MPQCRHSSMISSITFRMNPENPSLGILGVVFRSRSYYEYFDVPVYMYQTLCFINDEEGSVGQFVNEYLKNHFRYEKCN